MKLNLRRKNKKSKNPEQDITQMIDHELAPYLKRDDLLAYLQGEKDKEKKRRLWNALPKNVKVQIVRHMRAKKGEHNAKK